MADEQGNRSRKATGEWLIRDSGGGMHRVGGRGERVCSESSETDERESGRKAFK